MKAEVTYTEEVERTEEMLVCEECLREVDEYGTAFVEKEAGATQEVHFCSDCVPSDKNEKPEHVVRAEEWFDGTDNACSSVKQNITLVMAFSATACLCIISLTAASVLGAPTFIVSSLGLIALGLTFIAVKLLQDSLNVVMNTERNP